MPNFRPVLFVDEDGGTYGVPNVGGKPRVSAMPYLYDVAEGNIVGHAGWNHLGFNPDVQTAEEIVAPQGGSYVFLAAETQLYAIMDNLADRNTGTGIGSLYVYYTDDDYTAKVTEATLNAASVALGAADTFRINNVRAKTVGTAGKAVGNIKIANAAGTVTYGYINSGNTRSRQFVYTVPLGKTLHLVQANIYCSHTAANKRSAVTLRANYDEQLGSKVSFFLPHAEALLSESPIAVTYTMPKSFPEKVDVKVEASSTGTASIAIVMAGWLDNA